MSRIGNAPIEVPKGVTFTATESTLSVKGPKGQLQIATNPFVTVAQEDGNIICKRSDDSTKARSAHGLMRALTNNMVLGVTKGFVRKLEINGVGYRAEVKGKQIVLNLGFSHPINYDLPEGVTAKVEKNIITLEGIDKQKLGAAAAKVRSFRPPEPYKGKGVKYVEERIQRKVGKAAG